MPLLYVVQADNGRIVAFEETRSPAASASPARGFPPPLRRMRCWCGASAPAC